MPLTLPHDRPHRDHDRPQTLPHDEVILCGLSGHIGYRSQYQINQTPYS